MPGLDQTKLFNSLNESELQTLRKASVEREFPASHTIFHEGDPGDGIYIVREGLVQISVVVGQGERRVLTRAAAGDFFGEMAVLDGDPRSASATTDQPTKVFFIARDKLLKLIEASPRLAVSLVREFSQRMRDFNRQYVEEVLQAERLTLVGRFARSIVHDFKNPLNVIGLAAELVNMEKVSPEMRKTATERIHKQVDRLNNMISELLEFTRGSQQGTVFASHDYAKYINELMEELGPETEQRGVKLIVRNPPPGVLVPMDKKRLLHVFTNLIHNAVDALQGSGEVFLSFQEKPGEVVTEIEDTGQGIAPEILSRLFEPFATFGKAKGTGLGLSICKRIVEDHRGWIKARNEPGRGAIFTFALPLQQGG
ncbi:MAG TPA: ATP-binding protein [Verrucomicrobiae bacterium]|nr:ATP-binding protein [Verrucomicrobiae bacterium]